ncbi:furin-1-like [Stegastes partitus]|uniref:Furin-1-like n=1 Tax=Stegastes partitus TaxID=144197 RepID=A0A9Y4MZ29_9TELE|nr:PREDICTED: furin-1-like [Stegastes partitus]
MIQKRRKEMSGKVENFGFGLLDAGLMVQQAAHFHTIAPQRMCTQEVTLHPTRIFSPGAGVSVNIQSEACQGRANEVNTLEHVQVRVSISAACRGDLSISLQSPGGTVSMLLGTRPNDASTAGLKNWTLMTVHCWGEQPRGLWTLQIYCPLCDQLPGPSVSQRRRGSTVKPSHTTAPLLITGGPRRVTAMLATRISARI